MNSTVNSSTSSDGVFAIQDARPHTIVLQPNGDLDQTRSQSFQRSLEEALELATQNVIVDLLWVSTTDSYGIAALVAGIEKAAALGKSVSFQSMNNSTRAAMEEEWDRQRGIRFGSWSDLFIEELEQYLDGKNDGFQNRSGSQLS